MEASALLLRIRKVERSTGPNVVDVPPKAPHVGPIHSIPKLILQPLPQVGDAGTEQIQCPS